MNKKAAITSITVLSFLLVCGTSAGIYNQFKLNNDSFQKTSEDVSTIISSNNTTNNTNENIIDFSNENSIYNTGLEVVKEVEENNHTIKVCVHICGAVRNEGVYYLDAGSRLYEAVDMAGGFKEDAQKAYHNLSVLLTDGSKYYFPTKEEVEKTEESFWIDDKKDQNDSFPININTASKEQLEKIPGIGETRAKNILEYREKNGDFVEKSDIKKVNGIGDYVFSQIEAYISCK